jgi:hypothetical protein
VGVIGGGSGRDWPKQVQAMAMGKISIRGRCFFIYQIFRAQQYAYWTWTGGFRFSPGLECERRSRLIVVQVPPAARRASVKYITPAAGDSTGAKFQWG